MCSVLQSITFFLSIVSLLDGQYSSDNKLNLIDFNDLIVLAIGASIAYTFFDPNYENKPFINLIRYLKKGVAKSWWYKILISITNYLSIYILKVTGIRFLLPRLKYVLPEIHNETVRNYIKSTIQDLELLGKILRLSRIPMLVSKVMNRSFSSSFFFLGSFVCTVYSFLLLWISALSSKFYIFGIVEWMMIVVCAGLLYCYVCKLLNLKEKWNKRFSHIFEMCVCILFVLAIVFGYPLPLSIGEDTIIVLAVITCYLNFLFIPFMLVLCFSLLPLYYLWLCVVSLGTMIASLFVLFRTIMKASKIRSIIDDLEKGNKNSFDDNDFDYSVGTTSNQEQSQ